MNLTTAFSDETKFISPAEYESRSGLSRATVNRRLADGSIPFLQPGGRRTRVLIPVSALHVDVPATQKTEQSTPEPSRSEANRQVRTRGPKPRWRSQQINQT